MRTTLLSIVVTLAAGPLSAFADYRWSEAERKAMPEYCQARYSKDPALYERWLKIIGPHFIHTHHYCDGLGWMNRYYRAKNEREKKLILQSAYGSFMYMVPRVDETWAMRPELYLNLGTVLALQKNDGQALAAMLKAIELNPKMANAYSAAANLYVKLNKQKDAVELLAEGLRRLPGNTSLQRQYVKLGGQLPYPEPYAQGAQEPVAPAAPAIEPPSTPATRVEEPGAAQSASERGQPHAAKPAIGSPTNPWCRFCPDSAVTPAQTGGRDQAR